MSNPVLAAIDLAHADEQALVLRRARQIADLDKARLAVVTVVPDFGMSIVADYFDKDTAAKMRQSATEKLHQFTAQTLGSDAEIKHVIAMGNAYEEILKIAGKIGASTIVMGAHRPDFQDYLLGPNVARVARHAKCSVLVVRA